MSSKKNGGGGGGPKQRQTNKKKKSPQEIFNESSSSSAEVGASGSNSEEDNKDAGGGRGDEFNVAGSNDQGIASRVYDYYDVGEPGPSCANPPPKPVETKDDIDLKERMAVEEKLSDQVKEERRQKAQTLKIEGNDFYLKDNNTEANKLYSEALAICPLVYETDRAVFYANRAAAKFHMGTRESALDDCNHAIQLNPKYVKALCRRAQLYEDLDKPHEAWTDFQTVLSIDEEHTEALKAKDRLPVLIAKKDEELKKEMLGNLKKLGNMVLNPFGLSTDNFQFEQDPNTGSYSVNFKQQPKSGGSTGSKSGSAAAAPAEETSGTSGEKPKKTSDANGAAAGATAAPKSQNSAQQNSKR